LTATKNTTTKNRVERSGHLRWVTVADLHVDEATQRELRPGWAAQIAADFDPDRFTPPLVSLRAGTHYVIDGQHRIEAMRLMGWEQQQVQCWVYEGLSLADEADLFLWHNNRRAVQSFDKFRIAVAAERQVESDINRIVLANGLKVQAGGGDGAISAVGALGAVYKLGPKVLGMTLRILRDSYGDAGLRGELIQGIGLMVARYHDDITEANVIARLSSVRGGLGALTTRANTLRKALGRPMSHCIAAAAVDIINVGRGRNKLPSWWS